MPCHQQTLFSFTSNYQVSIYEIFFSFLFTQPAAGWVYPATFTALRLLHSAVYAGLAIPHFWRAQVFSLGVACTCGSCNLMMREVM